MAQNATYITPSNSPKGSNSGQFIKPTLLAFHGSGSNAIVHTVQLARLMRIIRPYFEVESLEAPFPSPAGPGVLPFFDGCGPFKRWLPPTEKLTLEGMRNGESTSTMPAEVEDLVSSTVKRIQSEGGKAVGLIGFSQGTRVVAGLMEGSQIRKELGLTDEEGKWCDFSFALSVCGSYPPPLFPPSITSRLSPEQQQSILSAKISTPTFHVQGNQDEWNWAGRGLIDKHYEIGEGKSEVVEWDMGHHYPVAAEESQRIGEWMVKALKRSEELRVG